MNWASSSRLTPIPFCFAFNCRCIGFLNLSESGESAARICGLPSRPEPHPICRIEDRNGQVVVRVNANSVRPSDRRRRLIPARVRWKSRASHLTEPTSRATQGKRQAVFGNVDALAHGSPRCEAVVLVSQGQRSAGAGSSAHHPGRSAAPAALNPRRCRFAESTTAKLKQNNVPSLH